jgi:hypothetical protein
MEQMTMFSEKHNQGKAILEHIRKNGSITSLTAVLELHILDCRKRISELRRDGHQIIDQWEKSQNGKRYKRYYLAQ